MFCLFFYVTTKKVDLRKPRKLSTCLSRTTNEGLAVRSSQSCFLYIYIYIFVSGFQVDEHVPSRPSVVCLSFLSLCNNKKRRLTQASKIYEKTTTVSCSVVSSYYQGTYTVANTIEGPVLEVTLPYCRHLHSGVDRVSPYKFTQHRTRRRLLDIHSADSTHYCNAPMPSFMRHNFSYSRDQARADARAAVLAIHRGIIL